MIGVSDACPAAEQSIPYHTNPLLFQDLSTHKLTHLFPTQSHQNKLTSYASLTSRVSYVINEKKQSEAKQEPSKKKDD